MEDVTRFEQLLKQHPFKSLSEAEKKLAFQFVSSEEEYESLRNTEAQLQSYVERQPVLRPRKETLAKLKQYRAAPATNFWIRPAVPAYAMALVVLIVGAVSWWSGTQFGAEKVTVEKIVYRTDTIEVKVKPDTVFRERMVYVSVPNVTILTTTETKETPLKGVNMKDKEELERLLVSGTH